MIRKDGKPYPVKDKEIRVKLNIRLNAVETVLLTRLLDSGLYGMNMEQVIKRVLDERLVEIFRKR